MEHVSAVMIPTVNFGVKTELPVYTRQLSVSRDNLLNEQSIVRAFSIRLGKLGANEHHFDSPPSAMLHQTEKSKFAISSNISFEKLRQEKASREAILQMQVELNNGNLDL